MSARQIKAARREFTDLQASIEDRRKYSIEQETLIKQMIQAGNDALRELEVAIKHAQAELKGLKLDVRNSRQDKRLLEQDIAAMQHML